MRCAACRPVTCEELARLYPDGNIPWDGIVVDAIGLDEENRLKIVADNHPAVTSMRFSDMSCLNVTLHREDERPIPAAELEDLNGEPEWKNSK